MILATVAHKGLILRSLAEPKNCLASALMPSMKILCRAGFKGVTAISAWCGRAGDIRTAYPIVKFDGRRSAPGE